MRHHGVLTRYMDTLAFSMCRQLLHHMTIAKASIETTLAACT